MPQASCDTVEDQVLALAPEDQRRMAMHVLAGWSFHARAANLWIAKRLGWFDYYGSSLMHCLESVDRANDYLPPYRRMRETSVLPDVAETRPGAPRKN